MKRNVKTTMVNAKSTMLLANKGIMNANNVIITQGKNTDAVSYTHLTLPTKA